jgi:hypothetical protein
MERIANETISVTRNDLPVPAHPPIYTLCPPKGSFLVFVHFALCCRDRDNREIPLVFPQMSEFVSGEMRTIPIIISTNQILIIIFSAEQYT